MKKVLLFILIFLLSANFIKNVRAQVVTVVSRYAACDLCGYCPPNTPPQSWLNCQKCLYPNINPDPAVKGSLKVDEETNIPTTPAPGRQYTFLGCIKSSEGFSSEGAAGSVVQTLLNVVFSLSGGIAFLYLLYGSYTIAISQANPERLNYGRRVVYGAIAGLIFTLLLNLSQREY